MLRAFLVLTVVTGASPAAAQSSADPWIGHDKALHAAVSAGLSAGGYGLFGLFSERPIPRVLVGAGFSLGIGAAKELWDLAGHGQPSWRDFTWDAIGATTGLLVALAIDHFFPEPANWGWAQTRSSSSAVSTWPCGALALERVHLPSHASSRGFSSDAPRVEAMVVSDLVPIDQPAPTKKPANSKDTRVGVAAR